MMMAGEVAIIILMDDDDDDEVKAADVFADLSMS